MKYIGVLLAVLFLSQCQKSTSDNQATGNGQLPILKSQSAQSPLVQNRPPEVEVKGEYAKAFLVAYDAFKQDAKIPEQKKQIEKYQLQFRQDNQAYYVQFVALPIPHVGGETDSGQDVTYTVSKEDYQVRARQFYK